MLSPEVGSDRLHELRERFSEIEPEIEEGPTKQALGLLHGMIQQIGLTQAGAPSGNGADEKLTRLMNYHKSAPSMEGKALNQGLPVGEQAPDFQLPDAAGELVRLSDFSGRPVVLAFYPLDLSPACSDQLSLYQQELESFEARGARLLGVSVDSIYNHGARPLLTNNARISMIAIADINAIGYTWFEVEISRMVREGRSERGYWRNLFEIAEYSARTAGERPSRSKTTVKNASSDRSISSADSGTGAVGVGAEDGPDRGSSLAGAGLEAIGEPCKPGKLQASAAPATAVATNTFGRSCITTRPIPNRRVSAIIRGRRHCASTATAYGRGAPAQHDYTQHPWGPSFPLEQPTAKRCLGD